MYALIGIAAVFAAVLGGFLLEKGNLFVLLQPAELLIVGGAAAGIVMVANPPHVMRRMWSGCRAAFRPPSRTPQCFLRHMRMMYEVFTFIQRAGVMEFEKDVESPDTSRIFVNHPEFLKDPHTCNFVCDSIRMLVVGLTAPSDLDQLMDLDIEVQRRGRHEPVAALHAVAEALPGLGIVAAVLGVVITMQAIGGAPELVGQKVAAALVGTFLGILLCYGVVGPIAARLEKLGEAEAQLLHVLRIAIVAFARGASPILAVEYARRSVPVELRPSFVEMELSIKRDARIPPAPKPNVPEPADAKLNLPEDAVPRVEVRIRAATGHHSGGAWKVAYADFVTALMALFIVLWLMNASQKVKSAVSGYFTDPRGFAKTQLAHAANRSGEGMVVDRDHMGEIRKQLEQALTSVPEFSQLRDHVKFSVTGEGLRIDLLETEQGMFFVSGSSAPTSAGQGLLQVLAKEISQLPNLIVIEGHTDSKPFRNAGPASGYSNWELASDRANAARRLLHSYGVRPEQVVEVRGFADQRPFNQQDRFDTRNRRVSIVVRFTA